MKVIFAGTPEVAIPSLEALWESKHELLAVLTQPAARQGRGRKVQPSPVAQWAFEHDIEVLSPTTVTDAIGRLQELEPDCIPVVAYGNLIPESALAIPHYGWVNLHFSLLPAWRGAAPVQHALLAGDEMTGASVFQIEKGLDTGPVFGQLTEIIRPTDTSGELLNRLAHAGSQLLVDVINGIEADALEAKPQPTDGVSLAPKINPADGLINWEQPAFAIDRHIRALTPTPGAWTRFGEERMGIGTVTIDPAGPKLAPGESALTKKTVHIGTGTDPVRLGEIKPAGKKLMPATAWGNGQRENEVRFS